MILMKMIIIMMIRIILVFFFIMNDDKTCFGGSVLFLMWSFIFLSFPVHKIVIVERFFGWNI